MRAYELLYIVNPVIEDELREATSQRIDTTITSQGGGIDKIEDWGKRKLAYEINGLADGDYTLVEFHAEPTSIAEISRVLRITDAVERFIIVLRNDVS
jgi:small subunit ribosomal protein S6